MKLSDALNLFESRIAKAETGLVTMTADDLVKYVGEQIALAEAEGDEGKERMAAVKAVIEASKTAESAGATSFEVKPFVAVAAKATPVEDDKDPVLEALAGLATTVKGLADSLSTIKPVAVESTDDTGEDKGGTQVGKSAGDANADQPSEPPKPSRVAWPTDLNR
jgi:hypothetical protein